MFHGVIQITLAQFFSETQCILDEVLRLWNLVAYVIMDHSPVSTYYRIVQCSARPIDLSSVYPFVFSLMIVSRVCRWLRRLSANWRRGTTCAECHVNFRHMTWVCLFDWAFTSVDIHLKTITVSWKFVPLTLTVHNFTTDMQTMQLFI